LKRKTAIIAAESDDISDGSAARASTCSWEEDVEPTEPCDLNLRFSFSKDFFGLKKSHQFISKSIASTALYYVTLAKKNSYIQVLVRYFLPTTRMKPH
jgi:hypothetical protein